MYAMCLLKRENAIQGSFSGDNNFLESGVYKVNARPYSSRPQRQADVVTRSR
ncbi:conserved hypothetical protein [Pseudomonas sp. 8Z]|nr:conserved hypothetical protein [Pseudomonas sp. 8Z]